MNETQYNGSRLTAHGSRLTAHGSRLIGRTIPFSHSSFSQFLKYIALAVVLCFVSFGAAWANDVSYVNRVADENGNVTETTETCSTYTALSTESTSWTAGWYVVNSNLTISSRVTVSGTVNLILCDGYTLTVNGGIDVPENSSITIYGQANDSGTLTATGEAQNYAGIGGGLGYNGSITINGGIVNSTGGKYGAGIGSGYQKPCSAVTINGGKISASGGYEAAGIGGGYEGNFGTTTINGGNITATGNFQCAGIGGGLGAGSGAITITGGTIRATGGTHGAGIGSSVSNTGSEITITGGNITANGEGQGAGIGSGGINSACGAITIIGGNITATGGSSGGAGIGIGLKSSTGNTTCGIITLGYTDSTNTIYANSYNGTQGVTISGEQSLTNGTNNYSGTLTADEITGLAGTTLYPAYNIAVSWTDVTADKTKAKAGDVITLNYSGTVNAGYEVVYSVNSTPITGNTFTMPAENVSITAEIVAITYTISYDLDGGTNSPNNPASYTIESDAITLTAPEKTNCTFTGWTGTGLDALTQNVTIPQGSTGDRKYFANWRRDGFIPDDSGIPEFAYHSLILSGQIGVMFYVYIPNAISPSNCTMDFDVSGDVSQNNSGQQFAENIEINGTEFYGYKCYINSVQMADKIHAVLNYNTGSISKTYSAKEYLDGLIIDTSYEADVIALGKATKNYGCYVQPVLADENNWVVGVKHAKMDSADKYTDDDFDYVKGKVAGHLISRDITDTGISTALYTLYLESETTIEVILTPENGHTISSVKCNGGDYGSLQQDGTYVVRIGNLSAHKLADVYTITGSAGTEKQFTVKVSALSYVQDVLNDETSSDEMKCAVTSLYKYYEATKTYRDNRPDEYK